MTKIDKIISMLADISDMYPGEQSASQLEMMANYLSSYELDELSKAIQLGIAEWEFFPTPASIVKQIQTSPAQDPEYWLNVINEHVLRFGNTKHPTALPEHIKRAMTNCGGYSAFCLVETEKLPILASQFRKACSSFIEHDTRNQQVLSKGESKNLLDEINQRTLDKHDK